MDEVNEKAAGAISGSAGGASSVTSGTASESLIKAASASSAESDLAGGVKDTSDLAGDAGASGASADTKVQPNLTGEAGAAAARGEAPEPRITAAVRNARAEVEEKYSWAKGFTPDDVADIQTALALVRDIRTNPREFYTRFGQELESRLPGEKKPKVEEKFPEPGLISQDGKERAYSASQMEQIISLVENRITSRLTDQFKPTTEFVGSAREEQAKAANRMRSVELANEALSTARALPHFQVAGADGKLVDHPDILKNIQALPAETRAKIGPIGSLYLAYNQYLAANVFPTADQDAEKRVRASFDKKAAASIGASPTSQGGNGKPQELKTVSDLARRMEQMAGGG